MTNPDSSADTLDHIEKVAFNLAKVVSLLTFAAGRHDHSKLLPPEKEVYDRVRPLLDAAEYESPEYRAASDQLGDAFKHHCEVNSHHPQHYPNGVDGMNLIDVIEMVCDWQAASRRRPDTDVRDGLQVNYQKYDIGPQLAQIIDNTVELLFPKNSPNLPPGAYV